MTLTLDHIQRLNLYALLGAQRGDVATIRAIWALQDKITLTSEEEAELELKREVADGHERMIWNPSRSLPAKELALSDAELARLKAAVETWNSYGVNSDRRWLEPLLCAIAVP